MDIKFDLLPETDGKPGRKTDATNWVQQIDKNLPVGSVTWARLPVKYKIKGSAASYARGVKRGHGAWAECGPWLASIRRDGDVYYVWVKKLDVNAAPAPAPVEVDEDLVRFQ